MQKNKAVSFWAIAKEDTVSIEDKLLEITMRMEMDRKNKIKSWTDVGLNNPFDVLKTQKKAKVWITNLDFWSQVYEGSLLLSGMDSKSEFI